MKFNNIEYFYVCKTNKKIIIEKYFYRINMKNIGSTTNKYTCHGLSKKSIIRTLGKRSLA